MPTALFALLASAFGTAAVAAPDLEYTAPYLGATLSVDVEGAVPGSTAALFFSPQQVEIVVPQGTLELNPAQLINLGSATVAGDGSTTFTLTLPTSTNLAEARIHLQAYVASGIGVLSEAIHARLLGDRVYIGQRAAAFGVSDQTLVYSDTRAEEVFSVEYVGASGAVGAPVFSANRALGAFALESSGVRVFDNVEGGVVASAGSATTHERLFVHPDGASFFEKSLDQITRVAFETGAVLDVVAIPGPTSLAYGWVVNSDATEAFVETRVGLRPALRHLDLVSGTDLGLLTLGAADHSVLSQLEFEGGLVLASTWGPGAARATLTQLDVSAQPSTAILSDVGLARVDGFLAFPDLVTLYTWRNAQPPNVGSGESFEMTRLVLGAASLPAAVAAPVPALGSSNVQMSFVERVGPSNAWFARKCCLDPPSSDEQGSLWSFDALTEAWGSTPQFLNFGPLGLAAIQNGSTQRAYATRLVPGQVDTPVVDVFDEASQPLAPVSLSNLQTLAVELFAVPIP